MKYALKNEFSLQIIPNQKYIRNMVIVNGHWVSDSDQPPTILIEVRNKQNETQGRPVQMQYDESLTHQQQLEIWMRGQALDEERYCEGVQLPTLRERILCAQQ